MLTPAVVSTCRIRDLSFAAASELHPELASWLSVPEWEALAWALYDEYGGIQSDGAAEGEAEQKLMQIKGRSQGLPTPAQRST